MGKQVQQRIADEQGQNDHQQRSAQNGVIQFVIAIAALHEAAEGKGHPCPKLTKPAAESIHTITFVRRICLYHYIAKYQDFNRFYQSLTDCLRFA